MTETTWPASRCHWAASALGRCRSAAAAAWLLVAHRTMTLLYDSEVLAISVSDFRLACVAVFSLVSLCFLIAAWKIKAKADEYALVNKKSMDQVEYFERFESRKAARGAKGRRSGGL